MVSTQAINTDAATLGHVNLASGQSSATLNLGAKRVAHVAPKQVCHCWLTPYSMVP
jgi:hypothetical protein